MLRRAVLSLVILSVASMAFGFTIPTAGYQGHVKMKFTDYTHYYDPQGNPVPIPPDIWEWDIDQLRAALIGLEVRSIYQLTSAGYVDVNDMYHETWSLASHGEFEEITGVLHNVVVSNVTKTGPIPGLGWVIGIHHAPKPPTPTDEDAGPFGHATGPVPGSAGEPGPAGGRMTLYIDTSPDFTNDPDGNLTPDDWLPGAFDGDVAKRLEYPGSTTLDPAGNPDAGVTLFFDSVLNDLSWYQALGLPNDILAVALYSGPRRGSAEFFLNSVRDGDTVPFGQFSDAQLWTWDTQINPPNGPVGLMWSNRAGMDPQWSDFTWLAFPKPTGWYGDAHGLSNIEWKLPPSTYAGWYFKSEDPVDFFIIPEPATCVVLGGGLLALVRRRKKRS